MDKRTKEALKASIEKWKENVVDPARMNLNYNSCPLCVLFHPFQQDPHQPLGSPAACLGCPVREKTGMALCKGTPYYDTLEAFETEDFPLAAREARAELAFLRSLLPKGPSNV